MAGGGRAGQRGPKERRGPWVWGPSAAPREGTAASRSGRGRAWRPSAGFPGSCFGKKRAGGRLNMKLDQGSVTFLKRYFMGPESSESLIHSPELTGE